MELSPGLLQSFDPESHYRNSIRSGTRPDGRSFDAVREITTDTGILSPKNVSASALARVGGTKFVGGVTLVIGQPSVVSPERGEISIQVQFTALASSRGGASKAGDTAPIEALVHDIIVGSRAVRLEDLCIDRSVSAWRICVDLVCVSYDGNAVDAAVLAAIACLSTLRLPETAAGDGGTVTVKEGTGTPLRLRHVPIPLTLCAFDKGLFADPTASEEEVAASRITVVVAAPLAAGGSSTGKVCGVFKPGGAVLSSQQLQKCLAIATRHAATVGAMQVYAAAVKAAAEHPAI